MASVLETPQGLAIKIQRYKPGVSTYSRRRTDEEWETYRQLLTRMHEQHYTRRQMVEALKGRDFVVTSGQLLAQLKKWDLMVYGHGSRGVLKASPQSRELRSEAKQSVGTERPSSSNESLAITTPEAEECQNKDTIAHQLLAPTVSELSMESLDRQDSSSSLERVHTELSGLSPTLDTVSEREETGETTNDTLEPGDARLQTVKHVLAGEMASEESIVRQLPIVTEPWCKTFPTTCCCHSFFNGIGEFAESPELYQNILQQSSPSSLKYALALLNLSENQAHTPKKMDLKEPLWLTITYYLQLCTRSDCKNSLARSILYRLLRAWESIGEERLSLPTEVFAKRKAESRSGIFARMFRAKTMATMKEGKSAFDWEASSDRDIGTLIGFAAYRPSTFPLVNWSGQMFGNPATWSAPSGDYEPHDLVTTAKAFADYMESGCGFSSPPSAVQELVDYDSPLVFRSLGLMLALELSYYANDLMCRKGQLSDAATWPEELRSFINTTVSTLSLNAEYAEKFRKSYWLASTEKIGYQGKYLHTGRCSAKTEWQILERNIHEYDEERTWIERRLFSGRGSWPQTEDLMVSDNASVRSVSSINSFRRFQALAFHLKIGTPHSRSIRTKSTKSMGSKMSLDSHLSWQLEHMLGLQEEAETEEENVKNMDEQTNARLEAESTETVEFDSTENADVPDNTTEGQSKYSREEEEVSNWRDQLDSAFGTTPSCTESTTVTIQ